MHSAYDGGINDIVQRADSLCMSLWKLRTKIMMRNTPSRSKALCKKSTPMQPNRSGVCRRLKFTSSEENHQTLTASSGVVETWSIGENMALVQFIFFFMDQKMHGHPILRLASFGTKLHYMFSRWEDLELCEKVSIYIIIQYHRI